MTPRRPSYAPGSGQDTLFSVESVETSLPLILLVAHQPDELSPAVTDIATRVAKPGETLKALNAAVRNQAAKNLNNNADIITGVKKG